jgi:hypothetical protein
VLSKTCIGAIISKAGGGLRYIEYDSATTPLVALRQGIVAMSTFKYHVVPQFRSDASLGWVPDLRSFLNLPELQCRDFQSRRHQAISNADMWTDYGTRSALLAKMCRVFDVDHPGSVPILNEFSERLTHAAGVGNVASLLRGS